MRRVEAIFARHGLRCTPQREAIYVALASTKAHPTAEELLQSVRSGSPGVRGVSLATVYNALDAFARRGLCRRLAAPDPSGSARFDADVSNHVHLAADNGQIRDVPPDLGRQVLASMPGDLIEAVERRMGVRVDAVRVEFVGRTVDGGRC